MDIAPSDDVAAYLAAEILRRGGKAIEPDVSTSIDFYELAAHSGNATAYRRLGDIYRTDETLRNPAKALAAYRSAGDLSDVNGAYRAGTYLTTDVAGPPDIAAAVEYLTLAAEAEYSAAYTRRGDIYWRGEDGLSPADAIPWYLRAAEGGSGLAFLRIAYLYTSDATGIRQPDLAIDYYRKAIDAGYDPAKVQLGAGLANGSLVPNRREEGVALLQEATEAATAGAAVALARMQLAGNGTPRDPATARRTLATAASNGNVQAARLLIQLRTTGGSGVSKNIAEARKVLSAIPEEQ
ncbi:MAG: hypothetical protein ABS75_04715 [Pelagibacterium sp. SCN 63-23]|nr:MAG: hypothetical protein ABS75_04715 [Pelagibacterium sp. SCN 63-23]